MIFTPPPEPITPVAGFEDLVPGQRFRLGSVSLGRDEIIDFAQAYDPQPFHLDDAAAAQSIFGQLVASGIQTIGAVFGLSVRSGLLTRCNLGGSGMSDVRWLRPVPPDDVLSLEITILSVAVSPRWPNRATVQIRYEAANQEDKPTLSMVLHHIVARGPA